MNRFSLFHAPSAEPAAPLRLSYAWLGFFLIVAALWPEAAALAQVTGEASAGGSGAAAGSGTVSAQTLGGIICNIKTNGASYPYVANIVAYIAGLFLIVKSVMSAKKHAENPNQPQIGAAAAQFFGGGFLMSLPAIAGVLEKTVYGEGGGAGTYGCNPGGKILSGEGGSVGLDEMMRNFVNDVHGPIFVLLSLICVMAGLTMIVQGLLRGAKIGTDPRAAEPKAIAVNLIFGAILISAGSILPTTLESLFGVGDVSKMTEFNGINWKKITGEEGDTKKAEETVQAILAFVQIVGGISFVRGWLMLKKSMEGGQPPVPQGLTHVIGGAMAINIDKMLEIFDNTFGTGLIE